MTFNSSTFSRMTFSRMAFRRMAFCRMTFSRKAYRNENDNSFNYIMNKDRNQKDMESNIHQNDIE